MKLKSLIPMSVLAGSLMMSPGQASAQGKPKPEYKVKGIKQSLGLRNNNPGNIRKTNIKWNGAIGSNSGFVVFETPEDGIRALSRNLKVYQAKYKLNTVAGIISRWAPSSENPTQKYIQFVSKKMGKSPTEKINLADNKTLTDLVTAIIEYENAGNPYPPDLIQRGINKP